MLSKRSTGLLAILSCLPLLALRGHDLQFSKGQSALGIPFDGANRHVAFLGRLNGHDGMRLVLDTGAGGAVEGSTVHDVDVALPGFELRDQTMGTLPLDPIAAQAGKPLNGILGRPLFEHCVVEIDYAKKIVNLFDAASYKYRGSGVVLPLTFIESLPYVIARVVLEDGKSLAGKFVIDTGAATNVILSMGTVEREGVLASMEKTITVQLRGVGGANDVRLGRAARLELGGFSLLRPVVALQPKGVGYINLTGPSLSFVRRNRTDLVETSTPSARSG